MMAGEINQFTENRESSNLSKEQFTEIKKINKLELVLSLVKSAKPTVLKKIEENRLKKLQRRLIIQNYLKSCGNEEAFGLQKLDNIQLTYTEQKALLDYISCKIQEECLPIFELIGKFDRDSTGVLQESKLQKEFIELEKKRRKLVMKLLEMKIRKFNVLKTCTDLKLSSHITNELDLLLDKYEANYLKANIMKNLIVREFCTQTEHTVGAVRKVENYIDALIEKSEM